MYSVYNFIILLVYTGIRVLALGNTKLSLFIKGRKEVISILKNSIHPKDKTIWIHAASLGEYEQGLPIMEQLQKHYPRHKLILTFFSPSGYEVKKNTPFAHVVCYMPIDSRTNVKRFLNVAHPDIAIFIKYEIWPNYLRELKTRNIPTLLISALFKENQVYFKWYGSFMKKALHNFSYIYVQNKASKNLLKQLNIKEVEIAGDTRFDRVLEITQQDNTLSFMEDFKQDTFCFVAGSTWPQDEKILVEHINKNTRKIKYVIAPHTMHAKTIENLRKSITKATVTYSEIRHKPIKEAQVIIIDTIGLLTKIYSYADLAYVGGGFATGLHNTLEPAVFSIPVLIGPQYKGFAEAETLVSLGGVVSISKAEQLTEFIEKTFLDSSFKRQIGRINSDFIHQNKGASLTIMKKIDALLS